MAAGTAATKTKKQDANYFSRFKKKKKRLLRPSPPQTTIYGKLRVVTSYGFQVPGRSLIQGVNMALLRSGAAMVTAFNLVPVVEAVLPDRPKTEVRHLMLAVSQFRPAL